MYEYPRPELLSRTTVIRPLQMRCNGNSAKRETFFSDLFLPQNRAQRPTGVTHVTTAPTMRDGNRCIIDFEPHGLAVHAKIDLHE